MLQENLDDRDVPLVDGYVERRLFPTVTSVQVDSMLSEQLKHIRFIAKAGVVDSAVTIFVLHMKEEGNTS